LAANAGFDAQESMLKVIDEHRSTQLPVGIDVNTGATNSCPIIYICMLVGEPMLPTETGVWDNYIVKKNMVSSA
jgi:T-complex protein 1 subunit zeta